MDLKICDTNKVKKTCYVKDVLQINAVLECEDIS